MLFSTLSSHTKKFLQDTLIYKMSELQQMEAPPAYEHTTTAPAYDSTTTTAVPKSNTAVTVTTTALTASSIGHQSEAGIRYTYIYLDPAIYIVLCNHVNIFLLVTPLQNTSQKRMISTVYMQRLVKVIQLVKKYLVDLLYL